MWNSLEERELIQKNILEKFILCVIPLVLINSWISEDSISIAYGIGRNIQEGLRAS